MNKFKAFLLILALFVGVFSFNLNSVNAYEVMGVSAAAVSSYPAGCTTGDVFSRTTGERCVTSAVTNECRAGDVFNSITGKRCNSATVVRYPTGCSSFSGWSSVTGEPCDGSTNDDPIIRSVSGPQTLNVNQKGTWKITASDPGADNLSYYVVWGDERNTEDTTSSLLGSVKQTATFSHKYKQSGTYYPTFIVSNDAGQTTETSLTVTVGGNSRKLTAYSSEIINNKSSYSSGQTIKFSVQAIDSDENPGTPAKGFNVQAWMQDSKGTVQINGVYQSVNATYNYNTSLWDVVMTAPSDNSETYLVETAFYCSISQYGCASRQINKSFRFNLSSTSDGFSISNSSPLPKTKVGANYQNILRVRGHSGSTNRLYWSVNGNLPPGLFLSASDFGEIITGAPTVAGTYTFALSVSITPTSPLTSKNFTLTVDPAELTPSLSSEQVKCVFEGSQDLHKCQGLIFQTQGSIVSFACEGKEDCVVSVQGLKGSTILWQSSCGGSSVYTTLDGNNEYAEFSCGADIGGPQNTW